MKVKLSQAVKMFFGSSSLEMVYFEAIANSLDANATKIDINISASAVNKPETLKIEISDNGEGFTDQRYKKFSNLFDVEESSHKGLGRLVYLCYFEKVSVESNYDKTKVRSFDFSEGFDENGDTVMNVPVTESGTVFKMSNYALQKIAKSDYVTPVKIKQRILEEFYSRLFHLKKSGVSIEIVINAQIEGVKSSEVLTTSDIPEFTVVELSSSINLIDKFDLYYSIEEVDPIDSSFIAAISVDNRTVKMDLVADENKPLGYKIVFLLYSDFFQGKIDAARQNLTIPPKEFRDVQKLFRKETIEIIESKIPVIRKRNRETQGGLVKNFPHLSGYFDVENIGYVARNEILKKAQDEFFRDQRDILDAVSLSDEQFEKSLEISSRALTEYILFRQLTIEKLKKIDKSNSEAEIHNLIVPQYEQLDSVDFARHLYSNNVWILDDKYMTYKTIFSDKQMSEIVEYITEGEYEESDNGKPDVAIIFSNDPTKNDPVDVVIVEFKKKGITLENAMVVETQLRSRAIKLMKHYGNRIQRIWFYGIVEFNDELELHLKSEYKEIYSKGKVYYKGTTVVTQTDPEIRLPVGLFIQNLDSVVEDADARNATFLNLIRSKFLDQEDTE